MSKFEFSRRRFLGSAAAVGAIFASPRTALAAGKIVATTYPGSFEEAYRAVVLPAFEKQTKSSVVLTPLLGVDQVAKISAARKNPPFDVVMFDEGPFLSSLKADIYERFPVAKSKYYNDLPAVFQTRDSLGPVITVQVVGIAYNPKRVKTPPTSWSDLWKPEYKGRVGVTTMSSSLGTAFMVEMAKLRGGGETSLEPAFGAMKELLPNLGAVAQSPGALAALFQQGQIDIAPNYFNNVQTLQSKGVDIAFAKPSSGPVLIRTSMHIVKNSVDPELAASYIDLMISPEVQTKLEAAPWVMIPTSGKVAYTGENARQLAKDQQQLLGFVLQDWAKINENRPAWIERFNREIRV